MRLLLDVLATSSGEELPSELVRRGWRVEVVEPPEMEGRVAATPDVTAAALHGARPWSELRSVVSSLKAASPELVVLLLEAGAPPLRELLKAGVSDFVFAPVRPSEVDARLRARMAAPRRLPLGPCTVDLSTHRAVWPGREVGLTSIEVKLLIHLWNNGGRCVSRGELLTAVWGYQVEVDTRAVALTTSRLRRKIEVEPDHPQHLLTVYGVGYRLELGEAPPPPAVARWRPFGLPTAAGALIGREELVSEVLERLQPGAPPVVLFGPGGIGKTRVGLEVARRLAEQLACVYVDASQYEGIATLLHALLRGLEAPEVEPAQLYQGLARAVARRPMLLVLDNFERMADQADRMLEALWGHPTLRVLLTSRVRLGFSPLQHRAVPPLTPPDGRLLFVERATAVTAQLSTDEPTRALIDAVVAALDRVPLALELAASRLQLLSLPELHRRLERRFELLGRPEEGPSRHHSLLQILEESWELLTPPERSVLVACAVFRGGFDLEAVERVAPEGATAVMDRLQRLLDHSLIQEAPGHARPRFALFESVTAFVQDKDGASAARRRHLLHYVQVAQQLCQDLLGPELLSARSRFELEHANLLAAFHFGVEAEPERAAELVIELSQLYWTQAIPGALELLDRVPPLSNPDLRLLLTAQRARHLLRGGEHDRCRALLAQILEETPTRPLHLARVFALMLCSSLDLAEGRLTEALARGPEISEKLERLGLNRLHGVHLVDLSSCHRRLGHLRAAQELQERALALVQQEGALWNEMLIRSQLGLGYQQLGRLGEAVEASEPVRAFLEASGDRRSEMICRLNLAAFHVDAGDLMAARAELAVSAPLADQVGGPLDVAYLRCIQARVALCEGDLPEAERAARGALELAHGRRSPTVCHAYSLLMWCHHLSGDLAAALEASGRASQLYQEANNSLEVGRLRLRQAVLLAASGDGAEAQRLWREAQALVAGSEVVALPQLLRVAATHLRWLGCAPPQALAPYEPLSRQELSEWAQGARAFDVRWAAQVARKAPRALPAA